MMKLSKIIEETYSEKDEKVMRAGIIPFYLVKIGPTTGSGIFKEILHMMFMVPSDNKFGGTKIQIAKGQIDDGENPKRAALREGFEELGLKKSNIEKLFKVGEYWNGRFHVYGCIVKDIDDFATPGDETGRVEWVDWKKWYSEGRREQTKIVSDAYKTAKSKLNL